MLEFSGSLTLAGASVVAIGAGLLVPGPAMVSTIITTARGGWRLGAAHSAGIITGSAVWAATATAVVAAAVSIDRQMFAALSGVGGVYLLMLSFDLARPRVVANTETVPSKGKAPGYASGLMLQVCNPKAVITWAAAIAISASPQAPAALPVIVATAGVILEAGFYSALVATFSYSGAVVAYQRGKRLFNALAAGIFAASGLWLLCSAYLTGTGSSSPIPTVFP